MTWWAGLPTTIREPVRSFVVSSALGLQSTTFTAVAVGYGLGYCGTLPATMHFLGQAWWGIVVGTFFGVGPYYRAKQAGIRLSNTVELPDGGSAILTPPKG